MSLAALLGVLGVAVWGAYAVLAANPPPAPTISSAPANPTNSTSASFTYTDSGAITRFECSLDGSTYATCGTTRPSTKAYVGLAAGSHTFRVRAVGSGGTSSSTSYTWTIDLTPPTVSSINRSGTSPTKANPLGWTVLFSEPVKNVATSNFGLVTSTLGGTSPSITSAVPTSGTAPQASWTVTVSTTGTTGANNGSIGLNLTSKGTIQDAAGNGLGGSVPIVGQAYTFDTTAPTTGAVLINANSASPTNATSVSWTVTFGEAVTGVTTADFALVTSGFTGTPTITSVAGIGATRTVTASTTTTTTNTATLQLKLSSATGITDLAGNALTGALPVNGPTYTVDRLAPPVAFTLKPPANSTSATAHFAWVSSPPASDFDHYACSVENGPYSTVVVQPAGGPNQPCASPLTYAVDSTNNGTHQFAVRAYDHIGNYTQITYSWKVAMGSGQEFTIDGDTVGLLYPGGPTRQVAVTLHNPNSVAIYVTTLTVSLHVSSFPANCSSSAFTLVQAGSFPSGGIQVPANGQVTLPAQGATAPTLRMNDSGNQDACKNANLQLDYSGSAHS
jgi:hypothetical protein